MRKVSKRRFTRINFSRDVTLNFQGRSYCSCRIKDLSLSGMYVLSRFATSTGESCKVAFRQVGPGSDLTIKLAARVVREDKDGMAIEFTSMTYDSYMFLKIILLYEAKDPLSICLQYPENCPFEILEIDPDFQGQSEVYQ